MIADSVYAACNDSGNEYPMMDSIVYYQKSDKALLVASQKLVHRGHSFMRRSKVGWQLCVQWRDGLTLWKYLKDLKKYQPMETAEYSVAQEIDHKPSFKWWVKAVLKKRLRIISLVKKRNT